MVGAQELPYTFVLSLQNAAETVRKVNGVVCQLKMEHSREGDTRPFSISLQSAKGRMPVEVAEDGSFHLPLLPEPERGQARLIHSLEKGALSISFAFNVSGAVAAERPDQRTLFEVCSEIADGFQGLDSMWSTLGQVAPELADLQLAIVGLSFPRAKPATGRALIKKGDSVVSTVDLFQAGPFVMMFDEYDPKEHTIVWEMPKDARSAPVEFIFRSGPQAKAAKNAIFIRRVEPGAGPNRRPAR
jgi:hypothetical protein